MSLRELAGYDGARARKGRLIEPRVRDGRLEAILPGDSGGFNGSVGGGS